MIDQFGKAKPYFETYVGLGLDKTKNKKDLIDAYSYLAYYYYNKGDAANVKANCLPILELDPENETGKELMKVAVEEGLIVPATPPTPAPVNGGGKGK